MIRKLGYRPVFQQTSRCFKHRIFKRRIKAGATEARGPGPPHLGPPFIKQSVVNKHVKCDKYKKCCMMFSPSGMRYRHSDNSELFIYTSLRGVI